jgi:hypothetical protein
MLDLIKSWGFKKRLRFIQHCAKIAKAQELSFPDRGNIYKSQINEGLVFAEKFMKRRISESRYVYIMDSNEADAYFWDDWIAKCTMDAISMIETWLNIGFIKLDFEQMARGFEWNG